jgi:hypothetical protein
MLNDLAEIGKSRLGALEKALFFEKGRTTKYRGLLGLQRAQAKGTEVGQGNSPGITTSFPTPQSTEK